MSNYVYIAPTGDGWMNLARDGYFLDTVKRGDVILYYYVNTNAVIIGRNQNAWKECNLSNMDRDGVQLVRRHTGGGAVYHDPGNLNFSFIMNERDYDLGRQLKVITDAVNALGVHAEVSGRNDILIDGRKFSGNAFGLAHGNRSHHGAGDNLAGFLQNLHNGIGGDGFTGAGLAHDAQHLAGVQIKRYAVDRLHFTGRGVEGGMQVFNF